MAGEPAVGSKPAVSTSGPMSATALRENRHRRHQSQENRNCNQATHTPIISPIADL
jgi:hypothetical protein